MTNEEMERVMNFIIERQELFAARMVESEERLTRLENITTVLAEKNDQLADTQKLISQDIRNLTTQVDRIAEAVSFLLDERGNNKNSNGSI